MSATTYRDAFPEPTHSRFDQGANTTTNLAPYQHEDSGLSPQAQFLAGPAGAADIESEARNHAFVSGLGAGKTACLVLRAWVNAEHWNPGELGMLIAPTVPAIKNVILPEMRSMGLLDVCEYNGKGSERPGIITPSGSRIILESADNDRKIQRLRGPSIAWAGIDEASSIDERAYEIVTGRLRTGDYRNLFVSTTPKGFNWVYDRFYDGEKTVRYDGAYEWLEVNGTNGVFGVPSWLNPHNPDDYIERLEAEFEGSFAKQEIEGAFTKFDGLVYPWFDSDNLVQDTPSLYDETIYGVDWGHNNPATIIVLLREGDYWFVADEWYETRCTVNDHASAAKDLYDRWGPGAIYCDPSEPANIRTFRRKSLDARKADNDVTPGIQRVSSMRDELLVREGCQNIRNEFNQYQYDDDGESEDPLKQNDHACFVAGTQVQTDCGERPIENIKPNDRVLTRDGYKRVTDAGKTAESATVLTIHLSNGRTLTGTPNHPVHTEDGRFKQLHSLRYGDLLTSTPRSDYVCHEPKPSSSRVSRSADIRIPTTGQTASTTDRPVTISRTEFKPSTGKCGNIITGTSPMDTSSITRMETPAITTSPIWSVLARKNMSNGIPRWVASNQTSILQISSKVQRSGTSLTKGENGTQNTGRIRSGRCSKTQKRVNVTNVGTSSNITQVPGSVQMPVSQHGVEIPGGMTKNESAKRVDSHLQSTNTKTHDHVRVAAVEHSCRGRSVYNLTVEEQPEYYANGVLVHNCDALRYALFTHTETGDRERVPSTW